MHEVKGLALLISGREAVWRIFFFFLFLMINDWACNLGCLTLGSESQHADHRPLRSENYCWGDAFWHWKEKTPTQLRSPLLSTLARSIKIPHAGLCLLPKAHFISRCSVTGKGLPLSCGCFLPFGARVVWSCSAIVRAHRLPPLSVRCPHLHPPGDNTARTLFGSD